MGTRHDSSSSRSMTIDLWSQRRELVILWLSLVKYRDVSYTSLVFPAPAVDKKQVSAPKEANNKTSSHSRIPCSQKIEEALDFLHSQNSSLSKSHNPEPS